MNTWCNLNLNPHICFYATGRLQHTAEDFHHIGWLPGVWITEPNVLWTREESFNFPVQERGAHSKRCAKKQKTKKRTTTIPIAGGKRQTSLWNGGRFGQLGRTGLAFRAKSLLLYLHVQTEMAPKSRAWQSFSSDQWQAYQNIYMLCSTAEDVKAWAKLSDYKDFKCT